MRIAQAEQIFEILLRTMGFGRFDLDLSPAMAYLECLLEEADDASRRALEVARARRSRTGEASDDSVRRERSRLRSANLYRFLLRQVLAKPLYRASGVHMPPSAKQSVEASRELLPTFRPAGELGPYLGEALVELRQGADVVLNVAPNGCMVSSMGAVLTPSILHADGVNSGRVETLLSTEGEVDDEKLTLAVLKATGPRRFCQA